MTKEMAATFSGTFKVVDSLDFDDKQIPPQYEARIGESETEKYIVAEENGEVIGFVVLDLPDDKNEPAHLGFRYVFPEHSGKKVGKKLSDEALKYCKENGFRRVTAGIHNVLIIHPDGNLEKNLDPNTEGTWKSYSAKTESSLPFNIQHSVKFVTIDKNGRVSLALDTHLNTQEQELLPDSPEGLMSFLREKGILPADIDNAGLVSEVGPDYFAVFKNGRKISFDEYMSLLVSKK